MPSVVSTYPTPKIARSVASTRPFQRNAIASPKATNGRDTASALNRRAFALNPRATPEIPWVPAALAKRPGSQGERGPWLDPPQREPQQHRVAGRELPDARLEVALIARVHVLA